MNFTLAKSNNSPSKVLEMGVFLRVLLLLGRDAVPVIAIALNGQHRVREGKVNRVEIDRVLSDRRQPGSSEGFAHYLLDLACAWPSAAGQLGGTAARASAEPIGMDRLDHLLLTAYLAGAQYLTLMIVALVAGQCSCKPDAAKDRAESATMFGAWANKVHLTAGFAHFFNFGFVVWVLIAWCSMSTIRAGLRAIQVLIAFKQSMPDGEQLPAVLTGLFHRWPLLLSNICSYYSAYPIGKQKTELSNTQDVMNCTRSFAPHFE